MSTSENVSHGWNLDGTDEDMEYCGFLNNISQFIGFNEIIPE
jgi:hypothetical protein